MNKIVLLAIPVVVAIAYYLFAPVGFLHGSMVSPILYGLAFVGPLVLLGYGFGSQYEEGSFLNKYAWGIAGLIGAVAGVTSYDAIKEPKVATHMSQSGARTMAMVTGGKSTKRRKSGTSYDINVEFLANGQTQTKELSVSSTEFSAIEAAGGIGVPVEIAYSTEFHDMVFLMSSAANKAKYGNLTMDAQPAPPVEGDIAPPPANTPATEK